MFLRSRSAPLPTAVAAHSGGGGTQLLAPSSPLSPSSRSAAPDPFLFYVSLNDDDNEEDDECEAMMTKQPEAQRPRIFRGRSLHGSSSTRTVIKVPAPVPSDTMAPLDLDKKKSSTTRPARTSSTAMGRLFRKLGFHHHSVSSGAAGTLPRGGGDIHDYNLEWSSSEKQLLGPSPTQSFSTLDETDEDDDNYTDPHQLLALGPLPDRRHHASILAAQERGVPTAVRWSDQQLGGSVVTSVMEFPYVRPAYLRVVILLLHPVIRRFEFLHCELPEQRLTVWDLLQQLPGLATEPSLKHVAFHSLCRHRRSCKRRKKKRKTSQTKPLIELIASASTGSSSSSSSAGTSSSTSYEDDGMPPADEDMADETATDPKQVELIHRLDIHCYELFEGEILLAIPNGFHPKSIIKHTDSMLENRQLMRMLHRAKLSGRALRRLKPSKTYDSAMTKSGTGPSRSPRSIHHSPRPSALPIPFPPPPPPPLSPYPIKPKSRSTPPASPNMYQQQNPLHGNPSPPRNSPPKSAGSRSSGSSPATPPRTPSRQSRGGSASPGTKATERPDGSSPRSVVVKPPNDPRRSILQPDLGPANNGDADAELEMHIQRAVQRELLLLQRVRHSDADRRVDNVDRVSDDSDDNIVADPDTEDDSGVAATDDERFFGSIAVDSTSQMQQQRQSPFEFPKLTESDVSSSPTADCHSLASRQLGGSSYRGSGGGSANSEEGRLSWEKWIAHYFVCGSEAQ